MYKMSQISENKLQCEKWLAVRKMSHTVNQRIPEPAHGWIAQSQIYVDTEALSDWSVSPKNTIQYSQPGLETRLIEIEKKSESNNWLF